MKCPNCARNHPFRDGMRCLCKYEFALNPKVDKYTDGKFVSWIRKASGNGTYFFTKKQLHTAVVMNLRDRWGTIPLIIGLVILIFGFFCSVIGLPADTSVGIPILFFGAFICIFAIIGLILEKMPYERFNRLLTKYLEKHEIRQLITKPRFQHPPTGWKESDIYDYGVEQIILTQNDLTVDLLVLNNLHSANRALVVSSNGYPSYLQEIFRNILTESPETPIYLLHDATELGEQWAVDMKRKFQNEKRSVIDMGVSKSDLMQIRRINCLNLKKSNYDVGLDVLPMGMICNGIALSVAGQVAFSSLLEAGTSSDAASNFG